MASWKEKGEVPDSDEEDLLDSQDTENHNQDFLKCPKQQDTAVDELDGIDSIQYHSESEPPEVSSLDKSGDRDEDATDIQQVAHLHNEDRFTANFEIIIEDALGTLDISPNPVTFSRHTSPSINSSGAFEDNEPPRFDTTELILAESPSTAPSTSQSHAADEISRSYIRVSSPASSILSSAPQSPASAILGGSSEHTRSPSPQIFPRLGAQRPAVQYIPDSLKQEMQFRRRIFRERKAIQVHPYLVEQQKYRQTLKARGVTPMRIEPSRGQSSHNYQQQSSQSSGSHVEATQATDSQDVDANIGQNSPSDETFLGNDSSPLEPSRFADDSFDTSGAGFLDDSDDELPSVSELAKQTSRLKRSRIESYCIKRKRTAISTLQNQDKNVLALGAQESDTLESQPKRLFRSKLSPSITKLRVIDTSGYNEPQIHHTPTVPRSSSSGSKQEFNLLFADPGTDTEEELELDLPQEEQGDISTSSSDESVEVRKVGRRLGGVLPASHLRLVHQQTRPNQASRRSRDSLSLSPGRQRRGIALPKHCSSSHNSKAVSVEAFSFLSDADTDDNENNDSVSQDGADRAWTTEPSVPCSNQDFGSAEEDDTIDAMLPPRKRQIKHRDGGVHKRRRKLTNPVFGKAAVGPSRQPKITESLANPRNNAPSSIRNRITSQKHTPRKRHKTSGPKASNAPSLGILDVIEDGTQTASRMPMFLKIATRTARMRINKGRHSPTRKFIRLDNYEDTLVAQNVLLEWRLGMISQRNWEREPPGEPCGPEQRQLTMVQPRTAPQIEPERAKKAHSSRRLVVMSRTKQTNINKYIASQKLEAVKPRGHEAAEKPRARRRRAIINYDPPAARPAQLEASMVDYKSRHPELAFSASKRALDSLYRRRRRYSIDNAQVTLNRFLADDDAVLQSQPPQRNQMVRDDAVSDAIHTTKERRVRKGEPKHFDAGAAMYRQPSEPLILDHLVDANVENGLGHDSRLVGLAAFGTNYPRHFDILPLQPGVFFHESTFIGSGQLAAAIAYPKSIHLKTCRSSIMFDLGGKQYTWGKWDDNVSSELGVCMDLVLEAISCKVSSKCMSAHDTVRALACIVSYVQHHLSFEESDSGSSCILRFVELFEETSSQLATMDGSLCFGPEQMIEILSRYLVLVTQILLLSRIPSEMFDFTSRLEVQLSTIARICVRFLLISGLDQIRKLYDDLQYLSVRERGIRDDQPALQAWVILINVFRAAQIPRMSFWNAVNEHISEVPLASLKDARLMEKVWYSLFTLLPLQAFDSYGVVLANRRTVNRVDNWAIPQQLINRVFVLYTTNSRQPPGFNDYCRSLVSRCHHLMVVWEWWKCSGIIGTVFDFFASQKLAHLRNEEVYKSPRFLEELNMMPPLDIEAEDRAFHIFLKMIALGIQHMREVGDGKGVRNLIARLLPNHDRQYPKEQAVHHRELASLRNHHDLLCTLYWSAPADVRPSVALIRDLVPPDRSHKEACLINLTAWLNLSRFVLNCTPISSLAETYRPLRDWQTSHFVKLLGQYYNAESDLRQQIDALPQHSKDVSHVELQAAVFTNQAATMSTIEAYLYSMDSLYRSMPWSGLETPVLSQVTTPANLETFTLLFTYRGPSHENPDTCMIVLGRTFLKQYLNYLSMVDPETRVSDSSNETEENDSQDFGSIDVDAYDFDVQAIKPLYDLVLPIYRNVVKSMLCGSDRQALIHGTDAQKTVSRLIVTWATLASLFIRKETIESAAFLFDGPNALFSGRRNSYVNANEQPSVIDSQWPLFLGICAEKTKSLFQDASQRLLPLKRAITFNIGLEWMSAISRPIEIQHHEHVLTSALLNQDHYLVSRLRNGITTDEVDRIVQNADFNLLCITVAINNMSKILSDPILRARSHSTMTQYQVRDEFSSILKQILAIMETHLRRLYLEQASAHKEYVGFVQKVAQQMRSHAKDVLPLPDFFIHKSIYFWPDAADPSYQLASLKAYTMRLGKNDASAARETFHYLYNSFKKALVEGTLDLYCAKIRRAARAWHFFQFMLDKMIPAAFLAAFSGDPTQTLIVITLCKAWFPVLDVSCHQASPFDHFINANSDTAGKSMASQTYDGATRMLSLMNYGLNQHINRAPSDGARADSKGLVSLVIQLGAGLVPGLLGYAGSCPSTQNLVVKSFCKCIERIQEYHETGVGGAFLDALLHDSEQTPDVLSFANIVKDDMKEWVAFGYQNLAGSYQRVELRIPNGGLEKQIRLDTLFEEIPTLGEVVENASFLLTIARGLQSKRVKVQLRREKAMEAYLAKGEASYDYSNRPRWRVLSGLYMY